MSAGEWAAIIAAIAFGVLVLLLAVPILKLGRTLDETTLAIRKAHEGAQPLLLSADDDGAGQPRAGAGRGDHPERAGGEQQRRRAVLGVRDHARRPGDQGRRVLVRDPPGHQNRRRVEAENAASARRRRPTAGPPGRAAAPASSRPRPETTWRGRRTMVTTTPLSMTERG